MHKLGSMPFVPSALRVFESINSKYSFNYLPVTTNRANLLPRSVCEHFSLFRLQVKPLPATTEGNKKLVVEKQNAPLANPKAVPRLVPPPSTSLPTPTGAPKPTPVGKKRKDSVAVMSRTFDMSCDDVLCSTNSFCVNDYTWGGARCHCHLGKGGESCSEGRCLGEGRAWWW